MPEDADPGAAERSTTLSTVTDDPVEAYATDDGGIVLYDSGNPLAWIESHTPVPLDDVA